MKIIQTYLDVEFKHFEYGIILHQKNYVNFILNRFGIYDGNSCAILIDTSLKFQNEMEGKLVNETKYIRLVESFLYLSNVEILNINFVVSCNNIAIR